MPKPIALIVLLGCGIPALAQNSERDHTHQSYQQLDKSTDGKLSPDELPAAFFGRLDADKNGFIIEEELKAPWRDKQ